MDVTPSRPGWGFQGFFKIRMGKELKDVGEQELSTIEDIRAAIATEHQRELTPQSPERQFVLKVGERLHSSFGGQAEPFRVRLKWQKG